MISLNPQKVSEDIWFYENNGSLTFYVEVQDRENRYLKTVRFTIRAARLKKSLARMAKR